MAFVLTNDDGIDAPGLRALWRAVGEKGVIIAPQQHHSGCSHQVTAGAPIHVQKRGDAEFAIAGTPADCTRVALSHLYPTAEFVLSGINAGGNLGADVYISGTVAAVREAALHRVPGIALSHYIHRGRAIDWDLATHLAAQVIAKLLQMPIEPTTFWNVNLPHLAPGAAEPEIVFCNLCTQPLPVEYVIEGDYLRYVGEYSKRARDPGSDVDICFSGHIAVTQLKL